MCKKTITRLVLCVLLLCGLAQTVSANTPLQTELVNINSGEDRFDSMISPDGIYPFLYDGSKPYVSIDIDTSMCIVGRLYVYDQTANSVTEIANEPVCLYTETKDYLYFITDNQKLCRSDYEGVKYSPYIKAKGVP